MNKRLLALFSIVVILMFAGGFFASATSIFVGKGTDPGKATGIATTTLPFENVTANATSTNFSFVAVGNASTTATEYVGSADEVWLYLQTTPSTTLSTYRYSVEYSMDNADFYGEDMATTSNQNGNVFVEHSSSTVIHRVNTGTVATTKRMIKLASGVGNYVRVSFSMIGGNGSYYADIIPKRNTN